MICIGFVQANEEAYAHRLSGTGQEAIDQALEPIKAGDLYRTFPLCSSSCGHENPCVAVGETEKNKGSCAASSVYTDSITSPSQKVNYCPGDRACCFPELCGRPVRDCTFAFDEYLSAIEKDIDVTQLSSFARLATDDLVDAMLAELRPNADLSTECTKNCNGWNQGIGDITSYECPSQCQCKKLGQANIVYSDEYLCKHTEKVNDISVITYNIGDASLEGTLVADPRVVCKANDECMNYELCMSNTDFQSALKEKEASDNQINAAGVETTSSGLSDASIVLIVVGSVAGVVVLIIAAFVIRKKHKANQDMGGDDPDTSAVYSAM